MIQLSTHRGCAREFIESTMGYAVWLHNPQRKKGLCPKLQWTFEGPYLVTKIFKIQSSFVIVATDKHVLTML